MQQLFYGIGIIVLIILANHFMRKVKDESEEIDSADSKENENSDEVHHDAKHSGNSENN
ncbi:MAG: hypothetical protein LBH12_00480 [Dysgonamonadaceae bacterium]|jgi:hypothetical protein|nr:hypothetical protein [Dysgonamonadaceae bacterium]